MSLIRSTWIVVLIAYLSCLSLQAAAQGQRSSDAQLGPNQIAALKRIRAKAEKESVPVAMKLAVVVKGIYANMLAARPNSRRRLRLKRELHRQVLKLLDIKGESIRESVALLTSDQKSALRLQIQKPGAPADLNEAIEKLIRAGA